MPIPDQQTAALLFTSASVLVGLAFVVMRDTWHRVKSVLRGVRKDQRWSVLNVRSQKSKLEKTRAETLLAAVIGILFLVVSLGAGIGVMYIMGNIVVDDSAGPFLNQDFLAGKIASGIALGSFVLGLFSIGLAYCGECLYFLRGKPNWFESD